MEKEGEALIEPGVIANSWDSPRSYDRPILHTFSTVPKCDILELADQITSMSWCCIPEFPSNFSVEDPTCFMIGSRSFAVQIHSWGSLRKLIWIIFKC